MMNMDLGAGPVKVQIVRVALWAAHKTRRAANPLIRPGAASLVDLSQSIMPVASRQTLSAYCDTSTLVLPQSVLPQMMSRCASCIPGRVRMHMLPRFWQS